MSSQYLHSTLALGHVLCLELLGRSELPGQNKAEMRAELQEVLAHHTNGAAIPPAQISDQGTASIVFFHDPKEPLRCAIDIAEQLPDAVRIGIHTGPVHLVDQGSDSFVGDGIDQAQRIMERASAGHILVSDSVAAILLASSEFHNKLHLCGDAELEPGRMVQLFSYSDDGGISRLDQNSGDESDESELPGLIDNRYRVVEKLGQGGMGRVYLAEDTRLDRFVALKLLTPHRDNEVYRNRFYREARAASRLNHPNIATIYDYGTTAEGQQYIVMELVKGQTLSEQIKHGPLRIEQAIKFVAEVADALGEAHRRGVVHRDMKPGNVVIDEAGKVKVLDFGLSKQIPIVDPDVATLAQDQSDLSQSGVILGTPLYLSPEQAKGETVDARTDIFAIGSMLYECLTGRAPFAGGTVLEICSNVVHLDPPAPSKLNPLVSAALDQITLTALAKDVENRFQAADELRDELLGVLNTQEQRGRASTRVFRGTNRKPNLLDRLRLLPRSYLVLVAVAVLLIGGFFVWYAFRPHQTSQESRAMPMYLRGTQSLRDGAYFTARKALEQAVKDDPGFALAHARLAEAYMELDVSDLARKEMLAAEDGRQGLSEMDGLRLTAIKASVQRDFATAVKMYETLQQRVGNQEGIHVDLGRAYEKNNQADKASQSYERAIQNNPQDAAAFVLLGSLYGRKKEESKALEAFKKAEDLYVVTSNTEGRAEVLYQRGYFFYQMSDYDKAKSNLEKALQFANENSYQQVRILMPLSIAYCVNKETDRAQKTADDAVRIARANAMNALHAQALVKLGFVQLCMGHNDDAEKNMTEGLMLARRFQAKTAEANALLSLASAQVQIGANKNEEGIKNARAALDLYEALGGYFDEPLSAKLVLARGNKQKGEYSAALNLLDDLLARIDTEDFDRLALAREEEGTIKFYQEKYPEALAEFRWSLQANLTKQDRMGEGFSHAFCAGVLWRLGQYDEASKEFDLALGLARGPDGYPNILLEVQTQQMEEALSRLDWSLAARLATSVLSSKYLTTGHAIRAKRAQALVALNQGKTAEARKLCDEAIANAIDAGDPALLYSARSILALVLLETQDAPEALKTINEDLTQLVSKDQKESLWQAYLMAARASQALGDIENARKYAMQSRAVLVSIQQSWGEQDYLRYVKRPDISSLLVQLQKLAA